MPMEKRPFDRGRNRNVLAVLELATARILANFAPSLRAGAIRL